MLLSELTVFNVRNIEQAQLALHQKLNVIIGANGAGKSSLLEALYIISTSKSFRTRQLAKVIRAENDSLTITCKGNNKDLEFVIGVRRYRSGGFQAKYNGEVTMQLAKITQQLPIIGVYPGFYERVAEKRVERLKLLDWSLFHVEHSYYEIWRTYNKVLKQRNALLKQIKQQKAKAQDLDYWDELLVKSAVPIMDARDRMVLRLEKLFLDYLSVFQLSSNDANLKCLQGIKKDIDFEECLSNARATDILKGYTVYGPHRADLQMLLGKQFLFDVASRGQQKVAINALVLAMVDMFNNETGKSSMVFIDDLPSELDKANQNDLLKALTSLEDTQILITAIDQDSLPDAISGYNKQMFHVKHGVFQAMDKE